MLKKKRPVWREQRSKREPGGDEDGVVGSGQTTQNLIGLLKECCLELKSHGKPCRGLSGADK